MLPPFLHTLRRYGPYTPLKIKLVPPGSEHLTGSARRQDHKFERLACGIGNGPKRGHGDGHVAGLDARERLVFVLARKTGVFEVAVPGGWVVTSRAVASGHCKREHGFDPATNLHGGVTLVRPDRLYAPE